MDGVDEVLVRPCVIEFQAFRGNNDRFIIKELVILDLQTFVVYPFIFEPPFSFNKLNSKAKRTNTWLSRYFHHIQWYEGYITYTNLHSIMFQFCKRYNVIYTRGLEKRNWIQRYTYGKVYDIHVDRDFLNQQDHICVNTDNPKHGLTGCALRNAYRLASYLKTENICDGVGSGGTCGYKYPVVPRPQHQCYDRLGRGNISEHSSAYKDGNTTGETVASSTS